jgi:hypothetical protein
MSDLPDELRAAGLIVPEPSVTPNPFAACAEYMAAAGDQMEERQHTASEMNKKGPNVSFSYSTRLRR